MELLMSLVFKCYKNELAIEIDNTSNGSIHVWDFEQPENERLISFGYTRNWKFDTPEEVLTRMHKEVDDHLESLYMEEDVSFDEPEDKSRMTSYERKMKESGHKQSDFL